MEKSSYHLLVPHDGGKTAPAPKEKEERSGRNDYMLEKKKAIHDITLLVFGEPDAGRGGKRSPTSFRSGSKKRGRKEKLQ